MIQAKTRELDADSEERAAHPGWWTVLAVLLTAWIGIPMLLPLAAAAPLLVFRRRRGRQGSLLPTVRWAAAAWITTLSMAALAGERAIRSVPFGPESTNAARAWLDGAGGAVPSWAAMATCVALFAASAVATRGYLAAIVLAGALLVSAAQASVVFAHSSNVFIATLIALPVWSALLIAGMLLLLDPLAAWGEARLFRAQSGDTMSHRRLIEGGALIAGAFAVRLLAGPVTGLIQRLTIP